MRAFAIVLTAALTAAPAAHAELGINVYGLSYHFDQDKARAQDTDHQVNPGLGVRWRDSLYPGFDWFADAAAYRDSGRNTAKVAGAGVLWRAGEGLRLGGALAFLDSKTYNNGRSFIAPLPVAAYDLRRVTLNMVYLPKVREINDINALGFWLTLWLR